MHTFRSLRSNPSSSSASRFPQPSDSCSDSLATWSFWLLVFKRSKVAMHSPVSLCTAATSNRMALIFSCSRCTSACSAADSLAILGMLATTWRLDSSTAMFTWKLIMFTTDPWMCSSTYVEYIQLQLGHVTLDEGGGSLAIIASILLHKLLVVCVYPFRRTKSCLRKSRNIHGVDDVDPSSMTVSRA